MNKSCILIDIGENSADQLLTIEKIDIVLLATDDVQKFKQKYKNKVKNYHSRKMDNHYINSYNLTYKEIQKYRNSQLKVEHFLQRSKLDKSLIQDIYYSALGYWLEFFQHNKIDIVFIMGYEHGATWDSLIIDIAISKNIPVFNIAPSFGFAEKTINHIVCLNSQNFIKLPKQSNYNLHLFLEDLKNYYSKNLKNRANFEHPYRFFFKKQLTKFHHYIAYNLLTPHQKYKQLFKKNPLLPRHEIFKQAFYIKNLKKLYDKISEQPNFKEKYIYYALHLEPEASIDPRAILSSQLFIIKWLSSNLPKDWKLYIKEHTQQFFVYEHHDYFLKNIHYFRTMEFYKEIKTLSNVKLIDINIHSSDLIKNSQATSCISGTSLIQAITLNKPIIIFGKSCTFVELLQESFAISSLEDLQTAITKIHKGYQPKYKDLQNIIQNYTFLLPNKQDMYKQFFLHLINSGNICESSV